MHNFFSLLAFFYATATISAQQPLPLIRAGSKDLVIKDGPHILRGVIVPEAKPDIYWAEMPRKKQRISIHTDLDSIVLVPEFGKKYDMIIHDTMPVMDAGAFQKQDMFLDGGIRPCIQCTIGVKEKNYTHWYLFDTGNSGNALLARAVTSIPGIYDEMTKLIGMGDKRVGILPELVVSGHSFDNLIVTLEKPTSTTPASEMGLIGNAILHRFNVIIDNAQGFIYLKPNSQMSNPLETKHSVMRKAAVWAGVVASLLLLGYVIKNR